MNYGNSVMVCGSIIFRMLKISFGEKYNGEKNSIYLLDIVILSEKQVKDAYQTEGKL